MELDGGEKVLSGTGDPRFRDQAATPEYTCCVEMVGDVVQEFCWEGRIRHRVYGPDPLWRPGGFSHFNPSPRFLSRHRFVYEFGFLCNQRKLKDHSWVTLSDYY